MPDLIVHFKKPRGWQDTIKLHYWNTAPLPSSTTWPGLSLTAEGNDWFVYRFAGISAASIVFNDGAGQQTSDLRRDKEGWFFDDNRWYDQNPQRSAIPVITAAPLGDTYLEPQVVTLSSSNSDDVIYYTTDETQPTRESNRYTQAITIETTTTLLVFGVNSEGEAGSIFSFVYTINPNADLERPTITASQDSGSYSESLSVTFTVRDNHPAPLVAYYSIDGSEPTTASEVYVQGTAINGLTGPELVIEETTSFRWLVIDGAGNQTRESFFYSIGPAIARDFREETIYFLITSRFYDGDPSNNFFCRDRIKFNPTTGEAEDPHWRGDFRGLIQKLDYIKELGFSAIWITPPIENRSGLDYHGYHGYDWTRIDPRLESPDATYQDLINQAHARGLKIIQDVVVNHSSQYGIRGQVWIDHLPIKYYVPPGLEQGQSDNGPYQRNLGNYQTPFREDNDNPVAPEWYHQDGFMAGGDWESVAIQTKHLAGDAIDLATTRSNVKNYIINAICKYLDMGVDALRIDTVKHVERNNLLEYINAWKAHKPGLFVFGENLVKGTGWGDLFGDDNAPSFLRPWWYTRLGDDTKDPHSGGDSGFAVLDFGLFSTFRDNVSRGSYSGIKAILDRDWVYGDATKLVTFLQNHDVGPDNDFRFRFKGERSMAAAAYNLLWTIRGIPCLYYGEEIEFMKGAPQDIIGNDDTLDQTGRAYFGDHLTDEAIFTTKSHPLYQHIQRLNLIRRSIPALQKAPMSYLNEWGSGMSFVRDYNNGESYAVVGLAIGSDQNITFSNIRHGIYRDAVTGNSIDVGNGMLSFFVQANSAGIYVLDGPGQIGDEGIYLR